MGSPERQRGQRRGRWTRTAARGLAVALLAAGWASACGSRTGLPVWSAPCEEYIGLDDCIEAVPWEVHELRDQQVHVMLVMDKSGSMIERPEGYRLTKWDAVRAALAEALAAVQDQMWWGLQLFPLDTLGGGSTAPYYCEIGCCVQRPDFGPNIPIGAGSRTVPEILEVLDRLDPDGGTPTAGALRVVYDYFSHGDGANLTGDRYVLLATDGAPNCNPHLECDASQCIMNISEDGSCTPGGYNCCIDDPEACLDDDAAVERIEALRSIGVRTIVMGIPGVDVYADTLDRLAEAGGLPNTSGPRHFYSVSAAGGTAELTETLESIAGRLLRTCEVVLNSPPPPDRTLNVAVECAIIPRIDPGGAGWWLDDSDLPVGIVLEGDACDEIRNTPHARVAVLTGCPTAGEPEPD
jgi:hypothetical protein